jgi:uncharacterized membrane protein required for colicin V production
MNWVDIVVIIVLALSFLGGLKEGAVRTFSSLIALVIGIPLAGLSYRWPAALLSFLPGENWENFIGFYINLGIIIVILYLIFFFPRKMVGAVWNKGVVYRLLGGGFNLLGAVIGAALFTLIVQAFPIFDRLAEWVGSSHVLAALTDSFRFVQSMLPDVFQETIITY